MTSIDKPVKTGHNRESVTDEKGRIKPGHTLNPNGRPKGAVSVVDAIKRKLEDCKPGDERTYLELLTQKVLDKALDDGDVAMIRDIINRVDGMPQQSTDITSKGEKIESNSIVFTDFHGTESK